MNNSLKNGIFLRTAYQPWWLSVLRGAVVLLFGLFAVIRPVQTIIFVTSILGVFFLIDGIFIIFMSITNRKHDIRWKATLVRGIIAVIIGAVVVFVPAFTAAVVGVFFMYILGALALFHGVMELIKAFRAKQEIKNEWAVILSGIFFILLSALLFFAPLQFGTLLIRIIGILSIAAGGGMLFIAVKHRQSMNA
jgi:uncharacterized membrane protein HdeD (DUF308 family)